MYISSNDKPSSNVTSNSTTSTSSKKEENENLFETVLKEQKNKQVEKKDEEDLIDKLFEQIRLIVNSGLTAYELEKIEEIKKEIKEAQEKIKENDKKGIVDNTLADKIDSLLSNLKSFLEDLSKNMTSRYIKGMDNNNQNETIKEINSTFEKIVENNNIEKSYSNHFLNKNNISKIKIEEELEKNLQLKDQVVL